ncbi:hypothetical protein COV12_03165 [Candidatus Woesearchaeota archaeon CG10_big_fil_rev_8_21_14_0_10_32_24]|nr:MAG: hypothetical protein COV12_03165 [Candidatus Woesearchaeota archaeon CG10_big_fil_rev_8_21_14_0_10_32_24]
MDFVIDANILFAALIKNSTTSALLFNQNLNLFAPEFILEEFMKYHEVILHKTNRTKDELSSIINLLHQIITIVPQEEYQQFIEKAKSICPDEKDEMYFALALKLNFAVWSNDRKLKEQEEIKVLNTKEVLERLP